MKAANLTVSVPDEGCDKNCDYCISKITPQVDGDYDKMKWNLLKVKKIADVAGVTSVLITGKGEPLVNMKDTAKLLADFSEYPTELQTNGKKLLDPEIGENILGTLKLNKLNILAVSIDAPFAQLPRFKKVFKRAQEMGMLVRVCINVLSDLNYASFNRLWNEILETEHIDQFLLRNITLPSNIGEDASEYNKQWIELHGGDKVYPKFRNALIKKAEKEGTFLRADTIWGMKFFEVDGISVTWSDYCIQEKNRTDDIRSLIYLPDGHLYTSWNNKASKLF